MLTTSGRVLEKLTVARLVKKFATIYEDRRLIAVLTVAATDLMLVSNFNRINKLINLKCLQVSVDRFISFSLNSVENNQEASFYLYPYFRY